MRENLILIRSFMAMENTFSKEIIWNIMGTFRMEHNLAKDHSINIHMVLLNLMPTLQINSLIRY